MKSVWGTALGLLLAAQQSSATFYWGSEKFFSAPQRCNNRCSDRQQRGFDWSDLALGPVSKYGDFHFSGFECKDSFEWKSWIDKFQDRCIETLVSSEASFDYPTIGYDKEGFSIKSFQVTTEFETEIVFSFGMPDGAICKQTHRCSPEGTVVHNKQCGGATSVSFRLPMFNERKQCRMGIHFIDFTCGPPEFPELPDVTPTSSSAVDELPSTSEPAVPTSTVALPPGGTSSSVFLPSLPPFIPSVPGSSPNPTVPPADTTASVSLTTSTIYTTSLVTITSCAPEVPECPAQSRTPIVVTSTIAVSTTVCPVTPTPGPDEPVPTGPQPTQPAPTNAVPTSPEGTAPVPGEPVPTGPEPNPPAPTDEEQPGAEQPPSAVDPTATSGPAGEPGTATTATAPGQAPPPVPTSPCPNVVPQCLNTWLGLIPECNSNSDISCFCPSPEFTSAVIECIQAWGASDEEVQKALSYFTGICAPHVPENPGIITAIPSTITLAPTETATVTVPCTTITVSQVVTISNTVTSTRTSTVTVPQVEFTTATPSVPGATPTVGLIPAPTSPAPAPASTTPAGVLPTYVPTTLATVPVPPVPTIPATQPVSPQPTDSSPIFDGAGSSLSSKSVGRLVALAAVVVTLFL
ncbi:hypothetical protein VTO42DRAFT_3424 [Malbranchea cinnamomea]